MPAGEMPAGEIAAEAGVHAPNRLFFPCFDGLRALAAIGVLITHAGAATNFYSHSFLGPISARLDVGVSVFFLLSGFLLYRPFVCAHLAGEPFPNVWRFYYRRLVRILPAYWVALTVVVYVFSTAQINSVKEGLVYYGFGQIYFRRFALGGIVQAWTLCVEMSFYLVLPLIALAIHRCAVRREHRFRFQVGVMIALIVVGWSAFMFLGYHPLFDAPTTIWLPGQLDLFGIGMLLAVISARIELIGVTPRRLRFDAWWAGASWAISLLLLLAAAHLLNEPTDLLTFSAGQGMEKKLLYELIALFAFLPAVFGDQSRGVVRRFLRYKPIVFLGVVSYGIYLWHKDIIEKLTPTDGFGRPAVRSWIPSPHFLFVLGIAVLGASIIATLSWYLVERPILRIATGPNRRRPTTLPPAESPAA
jgi:peptidoglycan/LPS O-acetylase OafA/YrhL